MDEALELESAAALDDGRDLLDAELAREDDAREAKLLERQDALEVVRDELGRGVDLEVREIRAAEAGDAEVLHDERARTDRIQLRELPHGLLDVVLVDHRVERDIDPLAAPARHAHEVLQVLGREVLRKGARGEIRKPAINGISACVKRRKRGFEIPCGG